MNRLLLRLETTLTVVVMLMSLIVPGASVYAQESGDYMPDEIVVKVLRAADLTAIAAGYALDPAPLDEFGTRAIFRMRIVDGAAPPERAEELAADPRVVYAEPNFVGQAPELQWQSWIQVWISPILHWLGGW
jgi:hypothetical protein